MGEDKYAKVFRGKQLLDHALELCKELKASEIIVVGNDEQQLKGGFKFVQDESENLGPLGGILSGLNIASNETNIVLPCDTPFINAELMQSLLKKSGNTAVTLPCVQERSHPTIGIYKKTLIGDLEEYLNSGNRKMMDFIKRVEGKIVPEEELKGLNSNSFANLNTQKELRDYEY